MHVLGSNMHAALEKHPRISRNSMSAEEMVQMQQTLRADAVKRQSYNHDGGKPRGIEYVGAFLRMWETLEYDVKNVFESNVWCLF